METNIAESLDRVLGKQEQIASAREQQAKREEEERQSFLVKFDQVAESVIVPAVKAFAGDLEKRGHQLKFGFSSNMRPDCRGHGGVHTQFIPSGYHAGVLTPSMRFVPSDRGNELHVFGTCLERQSGGRTFDRGSYPLEKVNSAFVQQMLLELVDGGMDFVNYATRS